MNPILNLAVKAARRASKIILRYIHCIEQVAVEQKGRRDFVSEVDRMAEAEIINIIHDRYPNHSIVAEESGGQLSADPMKQEFEWIIDPLDGTINYLHEYPQFAVSIAVRQYGELQHAVILDVLRDELYTASRGQGAQLNNCRIRVTQQEKLDRALLATGFSYHDPTDLDPWIRGFKALLLRVTAIRCSGSAALDLAHVARGRLDGYWQSGLGAWDAAAGGLLVREAGGLIADFQGQQKFLENGQIVAANGKIFTHLMQIITSKANPPQRSTGPAKHATRPSR